MNIHKDNAPAQPVIQQPRCWSQWWKVGNSEKKRKWNLHKNYLIAKNWNMKTTNKNNMLFFVNNKKIITENNKYSESLSLSLPSVLWRCWLGGSKGIRPVKKLSGGVLAWLSVWTLERSADLHMTQLMPLPLTVSCFSKIQISITFLVPAHPGSPGQRAVIKRVCVIVRKNRQCREKYLVYIRLVKWQYSTMFILLGLQLCLTIVPSAESNRAEW